jgi:hypothetical protein
LLGFESIALAFVQILQQGFQMKKLSLAIILTVTLIAFSSCNDSSSVTPAHDVSGTWTMSLVPTEEHKALDPNVESSSVEEVNLAQTGASVSGSSELFSFNGVYSDVDSIEFKVSQHDQAGASDEVSSFSVDLSSASAFSGQGDLYPDESSQGAVGSTVENHFLINGTRADDADTTLSRSFFTRSLSSIMCEIENDLTTYTISALTDDLFRPMSGKHCLLEKDGGGYWGFAKVGPGSVFPVWTKPFTSPPNGPFALSGNTILKLKRKELYALWKFWATL